MKIKHIEAIPLVRRLREPFHGGTYYISSRNTIVTRVELEGGVVGQIYGGDEDENDIKICQIVNDVFAPMLVGEDVRDVERHWERMWDAPVDLAWRGLHALNMGKHGIVTQAIAAVDNALWDAFGKALGQPVYKLLGGFRDRVRVIAIGGYIRDGDPMQSLVDEIEAYKSMGVFGLKLKVGKLSIEEDLERTRLARRVGGEDFLLSVDANQAWTVDEAVRFARGARDIGLAWLEEPVQWHDQIEGNARVRWEGIPVNAGQGEISRHGCRDLVARGAVDILNVDVTIAGGVTEWRRIAGMARAFGIGMAHHEEPQISLHLLSAVPHGIAVEIFPDPDRDPLWYDLPVKQPEIRDGYMLVPEGPGFGIELDEDTIEKWRVPVG